MLVCTVFAFFVQTWAVRRTSPSRVSLLLGTEPVWAALIGITIAHDSLALAGYVGIALILAGTAWGRSIEQRTTRGRRVGRVDHDEAFEAERPRLTNIAFRLLDDRQEAEDAVQNAWLRLDRAPAGVVSLPAWLTTVTTRLCLDRLRARIPAPREPLDGPGEQADPAESAEHAEAIGQALHVVVTTLTPDERVAFILADSFGFDFASIGEILERKESAARQLASRARKKVERHERDGRVSEWQIVDAFMAAARGGDLERLLALLAPDAHVSADAAAVLAGTPDSIVGRDAVAGFFNGSASAALPVFVDGRPGAAWFNRGEARVVFDFRVVDGLVSSVVFRASDEVLAGVTKRKGAVTSGASRSSE